MICHNATDLLWEIQKYMTINNISQCDLAIAMNKSKQSINQIFKNNNPKCSTLFEICNALNLSIDLQIPSNSSK